MLSVISIEELRNVTVNHLFFPMSIALLGYSQGLSLQGFLDLARCPPNTHQHCVISSQALCNTCWYQYPCAGQARCYAQPCVSSGKTH